MQKTVKCTSMKTRYNRAKYIKFAQNCQMYLNEIALKLSNLQKNCQIYNYKKAEISDQNHL